MGGSAGGSRHSRQLQAFGALDPVRQDVLGVGILAQVLLGCHLGRKAREPWSVGRGGKARWVLARSAVGWVGRTGCSSRVLRLLAVERYKHRWGLGGDAVSALAEALPGLEARQARVNFESPPTTSREFGTRFEKDVQVQVDT